MLRKRARRLHPPCPASARPPCPCPAASALLGSSEASALLGPSDQSRPATQSAGRLGRYRRPALPARGAPGRRLRPPGPQRVPAIRQARPGRLRSPLAPASATSSGAAAAAGRSRLSPPSASVAPTRRPSVLTFRWDTINAAGRERRNRREQGKSQRSRPQRPESRAGGRLGRMWATMENGALSGPTARAESRGFTPPPKSQTPSPI